MSKTLLTWSEPFLFVSRLRTGQEWLWRLAYVAGITTVAFVLFRVFRGGLPWLTALEISLVIGVILTLLPDLLFLQRELSVSSDAIEWEANGVKFSITGSLPHANTALVEFYRPGEWRFRFAGMRVQLHGGQWFIFAVPTRKKLETIATILTRQGVLVTLSGWDPTTADTRTRVEDELTFDHLQATTRDAVFSTVPPEEQKLVPIVGNILASLTGAGPLLVGLLAMIGTWIYLGVYWGQLAASECWIIGVGGIAGCVLSFLYVLFIGQFIEKAIMISMARKSLRMRTNPLVNAEDDDVYSVTLYSRENWTNVILKSFDFGFLQVSRRLGALVFEGDKERWTIPLTSLTAVRIEEAAVGKEGAENAEIRFFVVIGTYRDDVPWEIGLIWSRTQWGNDNADARRKRMRALFDELSSAITNA
jgi:hypothetical protein